MTCAVYHWWSHPNETPNNLRTPILISISTLRAVSSIPIFVLDITENYNNWESFPKILNFTVIPLSPITKKYRHLIDGWQHLSRFFDLEQFHHLFPDHKTIIYVDSDVFWLKNPLPLDQNPEKMCIDGWNTGFFYYNVDFFPTFWDAFKSFTIAAVYSKDIQSLFKKYINYDAWYGVWDEMIIGYMRENHKHLFNFISVNEHSTIQTISSSNIHQVKMFHANGMVVVNECDGRNSDPRHSRGLLGLFFKEFYEKIIKVVDVNLFYTKEEIDYYLIKQISLLDCINLFTFSIESTNHIQDLLELRKKHHYFL